MIKFSMFRKHLRNVLLHKLYVMIECFKVGLYWRGITHDLSKFSPTEFYNSVKNYKDGISPISVAKDKYGYSKAWQHHKGRNSHHHVYWCDNFDDGDFTIIPMPFEDAVELLCDYIAAGKVYQGDKFTYEGELEYFKHLVFPKDDNYKTHIAMHPYTVEFISIMLRELIHGTKLNLSELEIIYDVIHKSDIIPIPIRYSDPLNIEYDKCILYAYWSMPIMKRKLRERELQ